MPKGFYTKAMGDEFILEPEEMSCLPTRALKGSYKAVNRIGKSALIKGTPDYAVQWKYVEACLSEGKPLFFVAYRLENNKLRYGSTKDIFERINIIPRKNN